MTLPSRIIQAEQTGYPALEGHAEVSRKHSARRVCRCPREPEVVQDARVWLLR